MDKQLAHGVPHFGHAEVLGIQLVPIAVVNFFDAGLALNQGLTLFVIDVNFTDQIVPTTGDLKAD